MKKENQKYCFYNGLILYCDFLTPEIAIVKSNQNDGSGCFVPVKDIDKIGTLSEVVEYNKSIRHTSKK
jgi:hypothetical protein